MFSEPGATDPVTHAEDTIPEQTHVATTAQEPIPSNISAEAPAVHARDRTAIDTTRPRITSQYLEALASPHFEGATESPQESNITTGLGATAPSESFKQTADDGRELEYAKKTLLMSRLSQKRERKQLRHCLSSRASPHTSNPLLRTLSHCARPARVALWLYQRVSHRQLVSTKPMPMNPLLTRFKNLTLQQSMSLKT